MWLSFLRPRDRFSLAELRYLTDQLRKFQIVNEANKVDVENTKSNRGKLVKLGAVRMLLNMAKLGQISRVLLILCNMASVSRPALLDSGGVECKVGILRGGDREVNESTRESCVAVLYGLSHEGGLRFKGLAMAANAVEELVKVERCGRERANQKARRVLEDLRAKIEDDDPPENEEVDWEEILCFHVNRLAPPHTTGFFQI